MAKSASLRLIRYSLGLLIVLPIFFVPMALAQFNGKLMVSTHRVDLVQSGHYQRWVAGFEARYPNVRVEVSAVSDYRQLFTRRVVLDDFADVMTVPPDVGLDMLQRHFVPLSIFDEGDLYFSERWRDRRGHYAYPRGVMADGLIYNKAILRHVGADGPPRNRKELLAMCAQLGQSGRDVIGLALNIGAGWPLQHIDKGMILINGDGDYFNSLVRLQRPFAREYAARSALQLVRELYDSGCTEKGITLHDAWTDSIAGFESGIGFLFAGSWMIPELVKVGNAINNVGFVPLPFNSAIADRIVIEHDWGLAVVNTSKQQALAKEWLRYLISLPDFAATQGLLPSLKSVAITSIPIRELIENTEQVIEYRPPNSLLRELSAISDIDFMTGNYVREVLVSSDFNKTMDYLNWRWQQAQRISSRRINNDK